MEQIIITHRDSTTLKLNSKENVSAITKASQSIELLGQDVVDISVQSANKLSFLIGDKITVIGRDYTLNTPARERKISEKNFQYDMQFEGVQYDLMRANFNVNIDTTNNQIQDINGDAITGDIKLFLDVLISNANRVFGTGKWIIGTYPLNTKTITLTFSDSDNCLSVLQNLCGEDNFNTEFKIDIDGSGNRTINIGASGSTFGHTFEYGKGKGIYELTREKVSSSNIITRLNCFGGSKNIITPKYRASKLCLPTKSKSQSFIEDSAGIATFGIWENSKDFDDVYPHRIGVISSLGASVFEFVDSSMDFDLNEKNVDGSTKYLMDGSSAKISFNTGNLAGYEFEVNAYNHTTKKFTITSQTDQNDYVFPSTTTAAFQFAIGDEYIITDIYMPQSYIDTAEAELATKGAEYLAKYSQPLVQYGLTIDSFYLKNQVGADAESNIIWVGDYIPVKDLDIDVDKTIRVKGFTRDLLKDYSYQLTIADLSISVSIINRVISGMNTVDKIVKINDLNNPAKARRNWKDSQEVLNMIFDVEGDYYTDKIKPLSIETSMLSVGAKSMQFGLEGTVFQPNYAANKNRVVYSGGTLSHYAILDSSDNPKVWTIVAGDVVMTTDTARYVYSKCSRTTSGASILFSTEKLSVESDASYYHFLIGVLNSVDANNTRALALTYGFTTVNGRFIKTGRIQSADGLTYFDLDAGEFKGSFKFTSGTSVETAVTTAQTTATNAQTTADNIQVGARNLISITASTTGIYIVETTGATGVAASHKSSGFISISANQQYSLSTKIKFYFNRIVFYDATQTYISGTIYNSNSFNKIVTSPANAAFMRVSSDFVTGDNITFWKLEKGNKATDWTPAPEDVDTSIAAAQTTATNAATAASNAQTSANTANSAITDISNDDKITPSEKQAMKLEWDSIVSEKTKNDTQADSFAVSKTAYGTAYTTLSTYIGTNLNDLTTTWSLAVGGGATMRSYFKGYYNGRTDLLNAISAKAKTLADTARTQANTATTNAATAQSTANNAQTAANTAQATADNIQVGGVNLLKNTGRFFDTTGWLSNGSTISLDSSVLYGGYNTLKLVGSGGAYTSFAPRLKANTEYTISALVKGSSALAEGYDNNLHIQVWTDELPSSVHQETAISNDTDITTSWKVIKQTFRTPSSATAVYCRFYFYPLAVGYTLNVAYVMLEQGNRASDWKQATEDVPLSVQYLASAMQSSTDIAGGLVGTSVLLLKNLAGAITGGMSGLATDNVGMWTGGTYQNAIDNLAKIIMRKDGSGQLSGGKILWDIYGALKVGSFNIENGAIIGYSDGKDKVKFQTGSIPSLASLSSGQVINAPDLYAITESNYQEHNDTNEPVTTSLNWYSFGSLTVAAGTIVSLHFPTISRTITGGSVQSTTMTYAIYKYGVLIGQYTSAQNVSLTTGGTYSIEFEYSIDVLLQKYAICTISISTSVNGYISYQLSPERSEIGKDGFYSYWNSALYFYMSSQEGLKFKGSMDLPGILATGSIASAGGHSNRWGAKSSTSNATYTATGIYDVIHTVGATVYTVLLTPNVDGNRASIISKSATSFRVQVRNSSNTAVAGAFDYTIIGNN